MLGYLFDKLRPERRNDSGENGTFTLLPWGTPFGGEAITPYKALTVPAYLRGVNLISDTVAKVPCNVYRRVDAGGASEKDRSHPLYRLLATEPYPWGTPFAYHKMLIAWALLEGNSYARIYRNADGGVKSLVPLPPGSVMPVKHTPPDCDTEERLYYVTQGGTFRILDPSQIIHIRGLSDDGWTGLSWIELARQTLEGETAAQR